MKNLSKGKGDKAVKKFRSGIAVAYMGAIVAVGNGEAHAGGPASTGPVAGMGTSSAVSSAEAGAAASAFVSSQQAQMQTQVQIQNNSQMQTSSSTATGGEGGSANNAGNSQVVNLGNAGVRNNPGIGLGLMVPTAPCRDTYSVGASAAGMGGALAWSKADRECRLQDIGAAFIRAGFVDDGLALWCSIDGVDEIAPTCRRLKTASRTAAPVAGKLGMGQENASDEAVNEFGW
jgi:hypothetical protein